MKKTLIILMFTALVSISIVLMTPKKAKAETTQDITPFYGGDLLDGAELYLFQDYTETPNFENGYLSKKTISSQDVYYSNSVATHFNGWYKDLGMSLIDDYTTEETAYFWFYIPFNDLLARYFQLALVVSTPFEGDYVVKLKDEIPRTILTSGDMSKYLLMIDQGDKYVEWFAYQVYYPDYLTSFRPLTAQLAYEFGFDSGETAGFDSGYNSGYNFGYHEGYQEGLTDNETHGYYALLNFNQLVENGNFESSNGWTTSNGTTTIENNNATFTASAQGGYFLKLNAFTRVAGHKYYATANIKLTSYSDEVYFRAYLGYGTPNYTLQNTLDWQKIGVIVDARASGTDCNIGLLDNRSANWDSIMIKNVMCIDLTQIFGEGNEPDLERCKELFTASYYPYTESTMVSVNYLDGYNNGSHDGYVRGSNAESTKQLTATGWVQNIFAGMGSLLGLQIFPGVTIGLIVGIPFVISLAYFVIRAFRGGGGA